MIRIELQVGLQYQLAFATDLLFNVHAAHTPRQLVTNENFLVRPDLALQTFSDPLTGNRFVRMRAPPGNFELSYSATVDLNHYRAQPSSLAEIAVNDLPPAAIPYLFPSRYCESDRLFNLAHREFGGLRPGHERVDAIRSWVRRHVTFRQNVTNSNTSAITTLVEQVGVCRDFAHLMIALCRAVNVPARFVTGTDYGADPALGPQDFHAYVEVYFGGGWYIFDPSGLAIPMGFVRIGTGRDAADVAFATLFGGFTARPPTIRAVAVNDPANGFELPIHTSDALSTDVATGTPFATL
ncbi:MAG: transglutaminase family protein [Pseudomonadales bacterium]